MERLTEFREVEHREELAGLGSVEHWDTERAGRFGDMCGALGEVFEAFGEAARVWGCGAVRTLPGLGVLPG